MMPSGTREADLERPGKADEARGGLSGLLWPKSQTLARQCFRIHLKANGAPESAKRARAPAEFLN